MTESWQSFIDNLWKIKRDLSISKRKRTVTGPQLSVGFGQARATMVDVHFVLGGEALKGACGSKLFNPDGRHNGTMRRHRITCESCKKIWQEVKDNESRKS